MNALPCLVVSAALWSAGCVGASSDTSAALPTAAEPCAGRGALSGAQFRALMQTVAEGWRTGDAEKSARCFAPGAVYSEPPRKQFYRGRAALRAFFGPHPQGMVWHHLVFDEERQVGAGEYTYRGRNQYHGVVMIRIVDGLIANWREYQTRSDLPWERLMDENAF